MGATAPHFTGAVMPWTCLPAPISFVPLMGRRSGVETIIGILHAFVDRRRWRQAELARRVGITVPALRKHLLELSRLIPLDAEVDHPDVFWQLPRDWHPAGAIVK